MASKAPAPLGWMSPRAGARWCVGVEVRVRMKVEGGAEEGWEDERSRRVNIIGDLTVASIGITGVEAELSTAPSLETKLCVCV